MKCLHCRTENRPHARFCDHCGTSLIQALDCPSCKRVNRTDAAYCDGCGIRLVQDAATSSVLKAGLGKALPLLSILAFLAMLWAAFHGYDFYRAQSGAALTGSSPQEAETPNQPAPLLPPSPPLSPAPALPPSEPVVPLQPENQPVTVPNAEHQPAPENTAANEALSQAAIAGAVQAIRLKVKHSWIRPAEIKPGLKSRVRVRLLPDGSVIEAEVIDSSGNTDFDTSVKNAVIQASPLPVPADKALFDRNFRSFTFTFDPAR